jgi:hypothetical protein
MDIVAFIDKYGFVAFMLYVVVRDMLPWALNKYFPEHVKSQNARIAWEHKMEEQRIEEIHEIRIAIQAMSVGLTTNSERIATMIQNQALLLTGAASHHTAMMDAVGDMKEVAAARFPRRASKAN